MKSVEFHPEAEAEFIAAAQHYEGLAENLGLELTAFDRKSMAFARIEAGLIRARRTLRKAPRSRGDLPAA